MGCRGWLVVEVTPRWVWPAINAALNAVADGISLAAEVMCPRDHTGARRAQAVCDAAEAAEDDGFSCASCTCDVQLCGSSRAEGTQRADSFGEVGGHESPSPERPSSLNVCADAPCGPPALCSCYAEATADDHSEHLVSHEDLAAHLTAVAIRANTGHVDVLIDSFTRSLLADYTITKK